jgi:hypothetical protein
VRIWVSAGSAELRRGTQALRGSAGPGWERRK